MLYYLFIVHIDTVIFTRGALMAEFWQRGAKKHFIGSHPSCNKRNRFPSKRIIALSSIALPPPHTHTSNQFSPKNHTHVWGLSVNPGKGAGLRGQDRFRMGCQARFFRRALILKSDGDFRKNRNGEKAENDTKLLFLLSCARSLVTLFNRQQALRVQGP